MNLLFSLVLALLFVLVYEIGRHHGEKRGILRGLDAAREIAYHEAVSLMDRDTGDGTFTLRSLGADAVTDRIGDHVRSLR